ncbi:MAG: ATP-binding cassette domain-containing protein [Bacillota bacterium]|nr:ATP-binding cassette domain-containing protein [Bacillota bacterium]
MRRSLGRYRLPLPGGRTGQLVTLAAYLALSTFLLQVFPQSIIAFLLFLANLALVFGARALPAGWQVGIAAVEMAVVFPLVAGANPFFVGVATTVAIYVALALGLNIVVGLAGLLDLGYVAFYATGSYLWAIFSTGQAAHFLPFIHGPLGGGWFWPFLLFGLAVGALMGTALGIPVLRLHGDYLAIVTLGFGEIIRLLAAGLNKITNGSIGLPGVRPPQLFSVQLGQPIDYYFITLVLVGVIILVAQRLEESRIGRAWTAMREDEPAARAMGIPLVATKLLAFASGASFAGVMGVIFAAKQGYVDPTSFTFMESIGVVAMIVLGGMGSLPGVALGAAIVTLLNVQVLGGLSDWLNGLGARFGFTIPPELNPAQYHQLVFGLILVVMAILRPSGLIPARRRHVRLTAAGAATAGGATAPLEAAGAVLADPPAPAPAGSRRPAAGAEAHPRGGRGQEESPQGAGEEVLLDARGVTKRFGGLVAIDAVDMVIREGQIHSLIGPNGAGKTTFFNMITGVYRPDAGQILFQGRPVAGLQPEEVALRGISRTFQNIRLFREMTALENVLVGRHIHLRSGLVDVLFRTPRMRREESEAVDRAAELLRYVGLAGLENELARNLPYGSQRRLEIARALASEPRLLLLDEPAAGMNPRETGSLLELIEELRSGMGLTILLIEHDMKVVMSISDVVTVLDHGAKICEGTPDEVRRDPRVIEAYLGRSAG